MNADAQLAVGPAFRHDPVKSTLPGAARAVDWRIEPAVSAHRRLLYDNQKLGRSIAVPVSASPAVAPGVGVVVASDDGYVRLFALDLSKAYWQRRMDSSIYASVVLDQARRRVVVAATSGLIACFDLRGQVAWSVRLAEPVFATPTVLPAADVLVVAAFRSRCYGLALDTGIVLFERDLPRPWHATQGGLASYRDPYASPVSTLDGNSVVCCAEHVLCLAGDGTELWRTEVGASVRASPVAVNSTAEIAVCPVDGRCLFLGAKSGDIRGQIEFGAKITASPAVSGGVLAIGTQLDTAVGIDVVTRAVRWTSPHGGPRSYTSWTVSPVGDFIATAARGNVTCLALESGRFLWETSQVLGLPDHEPAMDITPVAAPDGSMYCASYAGDVYRFLFRDLPAGLATDLSIDRAAQERR